MLKYREFICKLHMHPYCLPVPFCFDCCVCAEKTHAQNKLTVTAIMFKLFIVLLACYVNAQRVFLNKI